MGAHYNHLGEAILMSTKKIGFYEEIAKLSLNYHQIHILSLLIYSVSSELGITNIVSYN